MTTEALSAAGPDPAESAGSVELHEVRGPSALGGGPKRAWDLLYLMAATEFKNTYFGTTLGYLWSIARPLALYGVLLVVFTKALHIQSGVPHYAQLLLLNLVLFGLFTEGTTTALPSIVSNEAIVRKTQFPRLVIPVASVLTATFNVALNLIVTLAFCLAAGITPRFTWLLLPVVVVLVLGLTVSVAMLLSSLYPRFRDMAIIWAVVSTALFYATPVLYSLETIHSQTVRHIIALNPLTPILALARKWVIDPNAPGPVAICGGAGRLAIAAGIYVVIGALAVVVFRREAPRIAEAL